MKIHGFLYELRRLWILIAICIGTVVFLDHTAAPYASRWAVRLTKASEVTMGALLGHGARRWLFPYLDLETALEKFNVPSAIIVATLYASFILAFALGL